MTPALPAVVEQRVREAARARRAGHSVTFQTEEGGAGFVLAAHYQGTRHAVFTSGTAGGHFAAMRAAVLALYAAQKGIA